VGQVEGTIGGNLSGGTYTTQLAAALTKLGVAATAIATTGECDAALSRKHRIIVEIPSDSWGNPDPGSSLGHFIEVYGFDGTNYHFMNPLGGRLMTISAAELIECERERGLRAVEVMQVMPADAGSAPAPTPPPAPAPAPPAYGEVRENFSGTVQVQVAHCRAEPNTTSAIIWTASYGNHFNFTGYCYAEPVYDPIAKQEDHRWYHISTGGWIASALVNGNAPGSHA
jgi:hypothetical protein